VWLRLQDFLPQCERRLPHPSRRRLRPHLGQRYRHRDERGTTRPRHRALLHHQSDG
jgi:hypothetical protein